MSANILDKDVYNIERSLGRVEGKLDVILEKFSSHSADDLLAFARIHERINQIDKRLWWMSGAAAAAISFFQFVMPNFQVAVK